MPIPQQNIFDELRPYARLTIVPGVTVGDLNFVANADLYSAGVITNTAGLVASDANVKLFDKGIGSTGQGWTGGLTESQTNVKFDSGRIGANQCYVGTHCSFAISMVDSTDPSLGNTITHSLFSSADALWSVATNFSWDYTWGRGMTRNIGPLAQWPAASGVYGITAQGNTNPVGAAPAAATVVPMYAAQNGAPDCLARKLAEPIIFAPLVQSEMVVSCGNGFTMQGLDATIGGYYIQILCTLKGFLFTMPVGG